MFYGHHSGQGIIMQGMFDRKRPDPAAVQIIKSWAIEYLNLSGNTTVSISELYCLEPECPPVETVITARTPDGLVKDWRIAKSINDVKAIDVKGLIEEKSSNRH